MSTTQVGTLGQWTVFLFGAIFNILTSPMNESLLHYACKTIIGGAIWFTFQVITNRMARKQKERDEQKWIEKQNEKVKREEKENR